jgi:Ca2+-binding RTX toxin-like protein
MTPSTYRKTVLSVCPLEAREVPATLTAGVLLIEGTNSADTVTVHYRADLELAEVTTVTQRTLNGMPLPPVRRVEYFPATEVREIRFFGFGGNDVFQNDLVLPAGGSVFADGGAGDDRLQTVSPYGSWARDGATLMGGAGNDVLIGGVGIDALYGGIGNDSLYGGDGNDRLSGDAGTDLLRAGNGNDFLNGGAGLDVLWCGLGDDTAYGGLGDDALFGEDGIDRLWGDDPSMPTMGGNDWLDGGAGADILTGGVGNDLLYGGIGLDTLDGGAGADSVDGGEDWDRDVITLGAGADTLVSHRFTDPANPGFYFAPPDDVRDFHRPEDREWFRYDGGPAGPMRP